VWSVTRSVHRTDGVTDPESESRYWCGSLGAVPSDNRDHNARARELIATGARGRLGVLLVVLTAALIAGCSPGPSSVGPPPPSSTAQAAPGPAQSGSSAPALARFYAQKLAWSDCGDGLQCAALTVPLNYADPGGRNIQLALIRAPATDPAHRIGALVTNPGGPGGSGVDFIREGLAAEPGQPAVFDSDMRSRFDIVGFDPRGVGGSAPIKCLNDAGMDRFTALDPAPTTPAGITTLVTADKAYAAACQRNSGELLGAVGTPNAARDMDVLRAALGEPKLDYLGFSYGTYLGAVYAGLFPDRVGRLVLDGPLPPELSTKELDLQQSAGFQTELNRFLADCAAQPNCPLGRDPASAAANLNAFVAGADRQPIPTGTGRRLDGALAQTGVLAELYDSPDSWPTLREALTDAMAGHGRQLLSMADEYNGRHSDGHYDNTNEANAAINCLDHPTAVRSVADVQAELPAYRKASDFTGAADAWDELTCAFWPVPAQSQPAPVHYSGQPPILVVGNTDDPATPYPGAKDMANQLGSAVLLTYQGDGHTAYGRGNTCIDDTVDSYFTTGTPPPPNTTCTPIPTRPTG
jgi:pimeloyl-ACP methyl ester carboxylesterase